jgi:long-chain acyl-CoA synthetase
MAQKHKSVLLPRMEKKPPFSFEVPGFDKIAGETIPRRNVRCKSGLITQPDPAVNTAYDIISYAAHKFGNAKCIGFRTVVKKHKEKTRIKKFQAGQETEVEKEWSYSELSPYEFVSFLEFQHLVNTLGSGLRKIGLGPGDKIHLYGATRQVNRK